MSPAGWKRILTEEEDVYCRRYVDRAERVAGRFAAKEAVAKALGTGFLGFGPRDIEILPNPDGPPKVLFHRAAMERYLKIGATCCHLSISHQEGYAVAFAILE
jgi:holo-[acyl-carrier protein] synthase